MSATQPARRRRGPGPMAWFVACLLLLPVVEIAVIIQVGQLIGPWPTVALLVVESAFGAWIVRREGTGAWRGLNEALTQGRAPGRELADSALILIGGTLLLTPGFVTDAAGFLLVIPPTRALARRILGRLARGRLTVVAPGFSSAAFTPPCFSSGAAPGHPREDYLQGAGRGAPAAGMTVPGEVVDGERPAV